jgi:hypothetical protein
MAEQQYQRDSDRQTKNNPASKEAPTFNVDNAGEAFGDELVDNARRTNKEKKPEKMELIKVEHKAAADGAKHIKVDWYWQMVGNNQPCGWHISSRADSQLTAHVSQSSYKKDYSGIGKLTTSLVPVAPIGTQCFLKIKDRSTGEEMEITATWRSLGFSLWGKIKEWVFGKKD